MDKLYSFHIDELINLRIRIRKLEQDVNPTITFMERESINDIREIIAIPTKSNIEALENIKIEYETKFSEAYNFLEKNSTKENWYMCENDGLKCRSLNDSIYKFIGNGMIRDDLIAIDPLNFDIISRYF